jgi:hypothetical protein
VSHQRNFSDEQESRWYTGGHGYAETERTGEGEYQRREDGYRTVDPRDLPVGEYRYAELPDDTGADGYGRPEVLRRSDTYRGADRYPEVAEGYARDEGYPTGSDGYDYRNSRYEDAAEYTDPGRRALEVPLRGYSGGRGARSVSDTDEGWTPVQRGASGGRRGARRRESIDPDPSASDPVSGYPESGADDEIPVREKSVRSPLESYPAVTRGGGDESTGTGKARRSARETSVIPVSPAAATAAPADAVEPDDVPISGETYPAEAVPTTTSSPLDIPTGPMTAITLRGPGGGGERFHTEAIDRESLRRASAPGAPAVGGEGVYRSRRPGLMAIFALVVFLLELPALWLLFAGIADPAGAPASALSGLLLLIGLPVSAAGFYGLVTGAAGFGDPVRAWLRPPMSYLPVGLVLLLAAAVAVG